MYENHRKRLIVHFHTKSASCAELKAMNSPMNRTRSVAEQTLLAYLTALSNVNSLHKARLTVMELGIRYHLCFRLSACNGFVPRLLKLADRCIHIFHTFMQTDKSNKILDEVVTTKI